MQSLRQMGAGIMLGIISVVVVLGGFSLAMAEGGLIPAADAATSTPGSPAAIIVTIYPTVPLPTLAVTPNVLPAITDTLAVITATASLTLTPPPTLTLCQPPAGWLPIVIQPYDTLGSLSLVYRTSVEILRTKNCLPTDQLVAGSILYVPPLPTSTFVPCGAPAYWGRYVVVPGDTLYHISQLYRVTVAQLMLANCLYTSNISAGQVLRVPNVVTSTPGASLTPFPTAIPPFTPTPSQPTPATEVPTATTEVPSPTAQATDTSLAATDTSLPTSTTAPTEIPTTLAPSATP